jgi:YVTN family beta-propeller protein
MANSLSLGDICQSMKLINGKLYLVVNNSGKIEICDPVSLKRLNTISGLTSPRYIVPAGNIKAYVTDTYSNHVSIINLSTNTVSGSIALNGWTEQMLLLNNKLYITNESSDYLYVVDVASDLLADSIRISKGANSISNDANGKIWVLCGGDYYQTYTAALYRIEPATKQIETGIAFASTENPSRLCMNASKDTIYFLNNGVWRMNLTDNTLPASAFIESSGNNFYALGIDPLKNEIYVSDAIDFVQRGKIYRYKADGSEIDNFLAGIIPGDFLFLP